MDDDDLTPHQRRIDDTGFQSLELILYQLTELKSAVREGFARMEGRFEALEARMASQEKFRERMEERDRAQADASSSINQRWIPLLLGLLGLGVTLWLAYKAGGA